MAGRTLIIGLTGSIGMGKTTVASQLACLGAKICSADAIVHRLLARDGAAVGKVGQLFPQALQAGAIDRKALGALVFNNPPALKRLEQVLHPLVAEEENRFITRERRKGAKIIVLDIPLLFETGAQKRCDLALVVTAPPFLQKQRVLKRPGMTPEIFSSILRSQLPDRLKRRRADIVISTGLGKGVSFRRVASMLKIVMRRSAP